MTKLREFVNVMNRIVPESYKESYDNVGLLVGDHDTEITGVLCCLDSIEEVIDEAIAKGCNLVVAHHPILFGGVKRLNEENYVHRVIRKAIKNDIAIYAAHTNLDNLLNDGVNSHIAERMELMNCKVLSPKKENHKLAIYASALRNDVLEAHFKENEIIWQKWPVADKNRANFRYETELSTGDFRNHADFLHEQQFDYEVLVSARNSTDVGSGIIGELPLPLTEKQFLDLLLDKMETKVVRHTALLNKSISKVAICGGAGSFLLQTAIQAGADILVTADFKYHEFFDADKRIIIADIGHFESEQFTIKLLYNIIKKNFTTFAVYCTEVHTNPVKYYYGDN